MFEFFEVEPERISKKLVFNGVIKKVVFKKMVKKKPNFREIPGESSIILQK